MHLLRFRCACRTCPTPRLGFELILFHLPQSYTNLPLCSHSSLCELRVISPTTQPPERPKITNIMAQDKVIVYLCQGHFLQAAGFPSATFEDSRVELKLKAKVDLQ